VKLQKFERLWILTVETLKITVFCDVMPCNFVYIYRNSPKGHNFYEYLMTN